MRNGKLFNVSGITPEQRRVVIDTFDAIHKAGDKGKLPAVRPPGVIHALAHLVKGSMAGEYNPLSNTMTLRPDNGGWSPEYLIGHEMGHWRDRQKPRPWLYRLTSMYSPAFLRSAYNSSEFNADAEAYRIDQLRHPESKMPERAKLLKAISAGKPLS